ncbi:DUF99 family protein [Candidatus Thorarchaeota archaeon]|nr:MAG: DUF99 family protein [Candidatus Thorarchaeota archaeon]
MNDEHRIQQYETPAPTISPQWKTGVRVLGVAESFNRDDEKSIVTGVVMRGDFRIDGFGMCQPTVGGMDSTKSLISLYHRLDRPDIRAWMLGGSVISWFNIVDIVELHEITQIPVVCVTYNPSEGIEKYLKEYFPTDWNERLQIMERAGPRLEVTLRTGHTVYLSVSGLSKTRAKQLVDQFTLDGKIPEPIQVARIEAAGLHRDIRHYDGK